jgi:hypothetical protein
MLISVSWIDESPDYARRQQTPVTLGGSSNLRILDQQVNAIRIPVVLGPVHHAPINDPVALA